MRVVEQREQPLGAMPPSGPTCEPITERDLAAQQFVDRHLQSSGELEDRVQGKTAATALGL